MGAQNGKADTDIYRKGYPGKEDDPSVTCNAKFYQNKRKSIPDGDYIDNIHSNWWGDYRRLEVHHGYIQWLFPIREHGMNSQSEPLQMHEIETIKADPVAKARVLKSYKLMLDFYGMRLRDDNTGEVERNPSNWKDRYENLNTSGHNYLRITRILKSLGELGYEHVKVKWIEFFIQEVYENRQLRNIKSSLENYFVGTLRNDDERARVEKTIESYKINAGGDEGGRRTTTQQRTRKRRDSDDEEEEGEEEEEDQKKVSKKSKKGGEEDVTDKKRDDADDNNGGADGQDPVESS
eukprot:TRINITY_DN18454_c0_g1_i1.p1 TRINITY_DN18454_c0_g1~~TRINITY_DN18454_c0_g1_i1.p1  ORF type:complete len:293 (-),score=74.70 TRINITY_DN18454_c0_g1_i1:71-949(-)